MKNDPKLAVCVFAHNPRRDVFQLVMKSLAEQTLSRDRFHVWIIDNASDPAICTDDVKLLKVAGVPHSVLREEKLGLSHARVKAIQSTDSEWLVFVDDDNELFPDYLSHVIRITETKPHLGCFGGKLLLSGNVRVPEWMKPLLPYLAIKDCGDESISQCSDQWGPWEPPGAGAVIRRPVLELYCERMRMFQQSARLGRRGKKGLMSAEDSLIMRGAQVVGLHCGYEPSLRLYHHVDANRLRFWYLVRLLFNYGRSFVVLERSLGNEVKPAPRKQLFKLLMRIPPNRERFCRSAWDWGYFFESRNTSRFNAVRTPQVKPAAIVQPASEDTETSLHS